MQFELTDEIVEQMLDGMYGGGRNWHDASALRSGLALAAAVLIPLVQAHALILPSNYELGTVGVLRPQGDGIDLHVAKKIETLFVNRLADIQTKPDPAVEAAIEANRFVYANERERAAAIVAAVRKADAKEKVNGIR